MKKVTNEELIARLNEIYAQRQAGRKLQGIENLHAEWYLDEEIHSFTLRVIGRNGEPTTSVDTIPIE